MAVSRRGFIQGCCAGIVAMSGARLSNMVFAQTTNPRDVIINVFLRGGWDALNVVVPVNESNYYTLRQRLAIPSATAIGINGTTQFKLHPSARPLRDIYDMNHLAFILAAGIPNGSRSHFEAQDWMDRGVPDRSYFGGGWMARYLNRIPGTAIFKGISQGSSVATSMEGFRDALAIYEADDFSLSGNQLDDARRALRDMYANDPDLWEVSKRTLDAVDTVDRLSPGSYTPTTGVTYANNGIANSMKALAQIIKMDIGLSAATVDYGGWDTHDGQADWSTPQNGNFANLLSNLSNAMLAFWNDMVNQRNRITIVIMSEFGRRLRENDNRGTDHGTGGLMVVINGQMTRRPFWGTWPGLNTDQLYERVDLAVTTDYRRVLSEILVARGGMGQLQQIFPGYTYSSGLGLWGTAGNPPAPRNNLMVY